MRTTREHGVDIRRIHIYAPICRLKEVSHGKYFLADVSDLRITNDISIRNRSRFRLGDSGFNLILDYFQIHDVPESTHYYLLCRNGMSFVYPT